MALAAVLAATAECHAVTARVRWLPSDGGSIVGYDLFVRRSGEPYAAAIDAGLPAASADGVLSHDVAGLVDGTTYFFTVTARGPDGTRSACPGELALGPSDPCHVERCCPGEGCTSGSAPDGTPCAAGDPCRACRAATCVGAVERPLSTTRLRLAERTADTRVSAAGTFAAADLDPSADGLTIIVFDLSGRVLLAVPVPPDALRANTGGTSFALARDGRDGALQMLGLRVRSGAARVRARLTSDLATRSAVGWAVASGPSCARSTVLACTTTPRGLSCR